MKISLATLLATTSPVILARTLTPRDPTGLHCNTDIVPSGLPDPDPQGAAACTKLINDLKTNPDLHAYRDITYSATNGSLPSASDPHFRTIDCAMVITFSGAGSSNGALSSSGDAAASSSDAVGSSGNAAASSGSQSGFTFNDWVTAVEGILASCRNWGGTAQIGGQSGYTAGVYTERVNLAMLNGSHPQDTPAVPNAAAYVPGGGSAPFPAVTTVVPTVTPVPSPGP
ncbi:MAG: hypothetical protein OHK93_003793 [Ramalina farinacea]|uniref:Ecp2 effector protein domain-containing protein n=1 Tax=Ramalina farinacea TaxID=258253 RepID=A0AA43QVQ8_9LECA|nr:hypothetical protein [Ramalina farinacea]